MVALSSASQGTDVLEWLTSDLLVRASQLVPPYLRYLQQVTIYPPMNFPFGWCETSQGEFGGFLQSIVTIPTPSTTLLPANRSPSMPTPGYTRLQAFILPMSPRLDAFIPRVGIHCPITNLHTCTPARLYTSRPTYPHMVSTPTQLFIDMPASCTAPRLRAFMPTRLDTSMPPYPYVSVRTYVPAYL
jgi:hypothetical protein